MIIGKGIIIGKSLICIIDFPLYLLLIAIAVVVGLILILILLILPRIKRGKYSKTA